MKKITFLTCWWTIDKDYWIWKWIYNFEIWEPSINKIIKKLNINHNIEIFEVLRLDSLDIKDEHREQIKLKLEDINNDRIIITHWTDTIIETWKIIQDIENKVIILVGSSKPHAMKDSDAELNIWYALWILDVLADQKKYWVYIAMNWEYFDVHNVVKNENGIFSKIS